MLVKIAGIMTFLQQHAAALNAAAASGYNYDSGVSILVQKADHFGYLVRDRHVSSNSRSQDL